MGNYNFKEDFKEALITEQKVAEFLISRGATDVNFNTDKEENYRFDIEYTKNDKVITLEVKEDKMYSSTGNVAIEYKSRNKPSSICTSQADFWCYVLGGDLYFVERSQLLLHLLVNPYRKVSGGDDNTSRCILVPLTEFSLLCDVYIGGLV